MKKKTIKELEALAKTYVNARDRLLDIIINYKGVGTKTYYNTVLKNLTAEIKRLEVETGKYIGSAIPREYEQGLKDTYDYFKKNNLTMKKPSAFAQIHNDAIYGLAREMQFHIGQGLEQAGRQVLRYLDESMDNALRKAGLEAAAEKIAMGSTVQDMKNNLIERLQNEGFMTVQYGQGKNAYQVSLDAYAQMVARSTTREAGNLARENQLIENGYDLVEMTTHYPTCDKCAMFQGRVYSLSGKDKRFPALMKTAFKSGYRNIHPNCRHVIVPWIEGLQTNDEIKEMISKSNKNFEDNRSDAERDLYSKGQALNRQIRQDKYQYERYKARLGEDAPKSFHAFRKMKKAGGEKWEQLEKSYRKTGYLKHAQNYKISEKTEKNAYSVNRKLVNSKKYHDKFENITPYKRANENIYQQSKRLLESRDGTEYESMVVLDSKTGNLIVDNIGTKSDSALKTGLSKEEYDKIKSHNGDFVIIHNHPGSTRPSGADILTFWKEKKATSSIVVGHDGDVFSISNINREIPLDKIYTNAYNKYKTEGYSDDFAKIKATNELYTSKAFDYFER